MGWHVLQVSAYCGHSRRHALHIRAGHEEKRKEHRNNTIYNHNIGIRLQKGSHEK
jgi:hypothetical protein